MSEKTDINPKSGIQFESKINQNRRGDKKNQDKRENKM